MNYLVFCLGLFMLFSTSCSSLLMNRSHIGNDSEHKEQLPLNQKYYLMAKNYFESNDFVSSLEELDKIKLDQEAQNFSDQIHLMYSKNYYSLGFSGQAIEYLDKISNESKIILSKKQLQLKIAQENDFELSVKSLSTEIQELISQSQN